MTTAQLTRRGLRQQTAAPLFAGPSTRSAPLDLARQRRWLASQVDHDRGKEAMASASQAGGSGSGSGSDDSSGKTPQRASRFGSGGTGKPAMSLEFFLLRGNIVKLYRDFLRASRNIPNPQARRETVDWLRDEHFEGPTGLRRQTDVTRIRELIVAGNAALKRICGPMELAAALNPEHGSFPKLRGRRDPPDTA